MVKHIILLGSSYNNGTRIALDYTNVDKYYEDFPINANQLDNDRVALHTMVTESDSWESVQHSDPFFNNVTLLKNKRDFMECLERDKELTTSDVANYILSCINGCTHLRLEKLLYFCYADYLCQYKERLFNDEIYAFKLGPVIKSIYSKYKGSKEIIKGLDKDYILPVRSRILNSYNGLQKINSINATIEKYKRYNANALIKLTHRENSPWAHENKGQDNYKIISDDDILKYHKYEIIL